MKGAAVGVAARVDDDRRAHARRKLRECRSAAVNKAAGIRETGRRFNLFIGQLNCSGESLRGGEGGQGSRQRRATGVVYEKFPEALRKPRKLEQPLQLRSKSKFYAR